jgi:hypothetical protein
MSLFLERALFVVAPQDSGKSTTLRSLFQDRRLGTDGVSPSSSAQKRLPEIYHLSNERRLYLRLTSPHEYGESPEEFIEKTRGKMDSGRWCFAGPLQPDAFRNMPDVVASIAAFICAFQPERLRVAFLSPNRHGQELSTFLPARDLSQELLSIERVEVLCLDGRERGKNGLLLADFFDFT